MSQISVDKKDGSLSVGEIAYYKKTTLANGTPTIAVSFVNGGGVHIEEGDSVVVDDPYYTEFSKHMGKRIHIVKPH